MEDKILELQQKSQGEVTEKDSMIQAFEQQVDSDKKDIEELNNQNSKLKVQLEESTAAQKDLQEHL